MPDPIPNTTTGVGTGTGTGTNITSGEKMVGLAAVFEELQSNFQSLLSNPVASGYAFYRIGKAIETHLIKNLKASSDLTREQLDLLDKFQGKDHWMLRLGAAIGGVAMKTSSLTGELRQAGLELNKFVNLSQLPGGATGTTAVATQLRMQALNYNQGLVGVYGAGGVRTGTMGLPTGSNEAFRQAYVQAAQDLMRQMQYYNMPGGQRGELSASIARYQAGLGINGGGMIEELMQKYSGRGMTMQSGKNILDVLAYAPNLKGSPFGITNSQQLEQMFGQVMPNLVSGTVAPTTAAAQTFRLFGALGKRGAGVGGATLGGEEMSQLSMVPAAIMQDYTKLLTLQKFTGLSAQQTQGAGGAVNVLSALQQFLQQQTGGKQIQNLSGLGATNLKAYGFITQLGQQLGFKGDEWAVMLNNMPKLKTDINDISQAFEIAQEKKKGFTDLTEMQKFSDGFKDFNNKLQQDIADSQRGLEFWSATGRKMLTEVSIIAQKLGIPQVAMDTVAMLGGAAITTGMNYLPYWMLKRGLVKKLGPSALQGAATEASGIAGGEELAGAVGGEAAAIGTGVAKGGAGVSALAIGAAATMATAFLGFVVYEAAKNAHKILPDNTSSMYNTNIHAYDDYTGNNMTGITDTPYHTYKREHDVVYPSLPKGTGMLHAISEKSKHEQQVKEQMELINTYKKNKEEGTVAPAGGEGLVRVVFSNDSGKELGSALTGPGMQQTLRIYSSGVLSGVS